MYTSKLVHGLVLATIVLLSACIGTDLVDEPLGNDQSRVELSNDQVSLIIDESQQLLVQYFNFEGEESNTLFTWTSANTSVATVDEDGLVQAVASGQTFIYAIAEDQNQDSVKVTVVADANAVAEVAISGSNSPLNEGESIQLSATANNLDGNEITNPDISWNSSQPSVASVDDNGLVTAIGPGSTDITATADGISSLPFTVSVLGQEITGTFSGVNGYNVSGSITLMQDADGFFLQMQSDFQTQSGPGLYVYYSTDAGASTFVDLGKLQATSGEQRYNIPASINTDDYRFVQIWCQPFGVSFGVAELQ